MMRSSRRGVALLVVISALALVVMLFIAVAISVESANNELHRTKQSQLRAQQNAAFLARSMAGAAAAPKQLSGLDKNDQPANITRRAAAPEDSIYAPGTGLRVRQGDVVITIERPDIHRTVEYLFNEQGRRPGVVCLGIPPAPDEKTEANASATPGAAAPGAIPASQ